jgi:hypothetical protein
MRRLLRPGLTTLVLLVVPGFAFGADAPGPSPPRFRRDIAAVFSRLGCNSGNCHGTVKGQNGFRLSLFSGDLDLDHERLTHEHAGRRLSLTVPKDSLLLQKATAQVRHEGGKRMEVGSREYEILRRWIAAGAPLDPPGPSRLATLRVTPAEHVGKTGDRYRLRVEAYFADRSIEDVTPLCTFETLNSQIAVTDRNGEVQVQGSGDTTLVVRYRGDTAIAQVLVPRSDSGAFPEVKPNNFIDTHILAKLRRLNLPPAETADDATFLRRACLDVTGELPSPEEIRTFLADRSADKRARKINELLDRPGYAAIWALKFCDLLKPPSKSYAGDLDQVSMDALRFTAWVRSRMEKNTPYDQFVEQVLTATSREGRSLDEWVEQLRALDEGYTTPRTDLEGYSRRRTLDVYWEGEPNRMVNTLQVAHVFLGLRLECAQCHRHPYDLWQQDDLLSFANFFMHVKPLPFVKPPPEVTGHVRRLEEEAKQLTAQVEKLRKRTKQLEAGAQKAKQESDRLKRQAAQLEAEADRLGADPKAKERSKEAAAKRQEAESVQAGCQEYDQLQRQIAVLERRAKKILPGLAERLRREVAHLPQKGVYASVTNAIGTQRSTQYRLLGEAKPVEVTADQDPRPLVVAWMRRPDNPYFAKAIVNRVWAHYFGRGIIDPPDHLSPFNPPTHPELLQQLCREFVGHGYDLKWLHRTILNSRTYQQSSTAPRASAGDRANYAYFHYRRLPAEVLLDALNQATGTTEEMNMKNFHWPEKMKIVEVPFVVKPYLGQVIAPRNAYLNFMFAQFGRPERNPTIQCDCERDDSASVLQALSFTNHPRVLKKITDENGQVARLLKAHADDDRRIEEIYLGTLSRLPSPDENQACLKYLKASDTPTKGMQGILWSLLNTREFCLQH